MLEKIHGMADGDCFWDPWGKRIVCKGLFSKEKILEAAKLAGSRLRSVTQSYRLADTRGVCLISGRWS